MNPALPRKILAVDDDPACRRLLARLLERAGYEVLLAEDGREALERVIRDRPGIVITDWQMPGIDGLELIRRIRTELAWYPYILLVTQNPDQQAGLDAGADDFISKPIQEKQLLPRVRAGERIISLQERLQEKNLELNLANQQLAELAVTDPLSGLLNRRAFFEQARHEWQRAQRYDFPLSCVVLDIDHFKRVNDTYGHAAGDAVICALAKTLKTRFRETDIVCRYGGEEFCVLLTNTTLQAAGQLADRLRAMVSELTLPMLPADFRFTVSGGLAHRELHTLSEQALIDHADRALLIAKRSGRNRVVCYDEIVRAQALIMDQRPKPEPDHARDVSLAAIPHQVVNTLLTALSYRHQPTVAHTQRVARLCTEFGQSLGLDPDERLVLEIGALLHDVGKLALPDVVLNKPGRLSEEEFAIAQRHRDVSVGIIHNCFSNQRLADVVGYSAQWYDGSRGPPSGDAIPLGARILALVSLFDDVTSGRGWWEPHPLDDAIKVLQQWSGTQFDPRLVASFVALLNERRAAEQPAAVS